MRSPSHRYLQDFSGKIGSLERSRNSDLGARAKSGPRSQEATCLASTSCLSGYELRPGANEPTLPINESARSIIDSNLPRTKSSRELGRFCALFGPLAGWNSPVFRAESGILSKLSVWSLLSTENERSLRLRHPTCRLTRKSELFGVGRFERARRSGDKGGDKFGGLTCRKPKPRRAAAFRARSSSGTRELGRFCALFRPKSER